MKQNNLMARIAKAAFALASVLILSLAFTACGNDEPTPVPPVPEPEGPKVAMIDGHEKKVDRVTVERLGAKGYVFVLYLQDGYNITLNTQNDVENGKPIDLTKHLGYWMFRINVNDLREVVIGAEQGYDKCDRGTLLWKLDAATGKFSIEVKDAYISAASNTLCGKEEHSFSLKWSGTLKVPAPAAVPHQEFVIDGVAKKVSFCQIEKSSINYLVSFFFTDFTDVSVIAFDSQNGKPINLANRESLWALGYNDVNSKNVFSLEHWPDDGVEILCDRGSMLYNLDAANAKISIEIKDAYVSVNGNKDGDGKAHTFSCNWTGTFDKDGEGW